MSEPILEIACPRNVGDENRGDEQCEGVVEVEMEFDEGDPSVGLFGGWIAHVPEACTLGHELSDAEIAECDKLATDRAENGELDGPEFDADAALRQREEDYDEQGEPTF